MPWLLRYPNAPAIPSTHVCSYNTTRMGLRRLLLGTTIRQKVNDVIGTVQSTCTQSSCKVVFVSSKKLWVNFLAVSNWRISSESTVFTVNSLKLKSLSLLSYAYYAFQLFWSETILHFIFDMKCWQTLPSTTSSQLLISILPRTLEHSRGFGGLDHTHICTYVFKSYLHENIFELGPIPLEIDRLKRLFTTTVSTWRWLYFMKQQSVQENFCESAYAPSRYANGASFLNAASCRFGTHCADWAIPTFCFSAWKRNSVLLYIVDRVIRRCVAVRWWVGLNALCARLAFPSVMPLQWQARIAVLR